MLHIFSRGDLDTGKAKFYSCDTIEDFAEVPPNVPEGSAVLVLNTAELYQIDDQGNWSVKYVLGAQNGDNTNYVSKEEFNNMINTLRTEFGAHQQESTVWNTIK